MSSSSLPPVVPQHSLNEAMLYALLKDEKEHCRLWLRAEMSQMADPLINMLFARLKMSSSSSSSSAVPGCRPIVSELCEQLKGEKVEMKRVLKIDMDNVVNALFEELTNKLMTNTKDLDRSGDGSDRESLSAPLVNEQSNVNLANWYEDDEYDCDCDECLCGIGIEELDGDPSIEDVQQLSPPAKKPRIELTKANNAQAEVTDQSSRQPTVEPQVEAQPNQVNKQFITVHLQCPQSNCFDTFPEDQLKRHMLAKHDIGPHRCLAKDRGQAFRNRHLLGDHIKQSHGHINQWQCNKCVKQFNTYKLLIIHNIDYHQLGLFQCSFPLCKFTGQYRKRVYNHYGHEHKQTLNCQHCDYQTTNGEHLKEHERIHSGHKPYRCKWPQCDFASSKRGNTIRHIGRHLAAQSSSVPNGAQLDPNEYVEVVRDLL